MRTAVHIVHGARKKEKEFVCAKKFPDCPVMPNDVSCRLCPYYKK